MNTKKRAVLYIVIACISWGSSCIFVNLLAPYGFSSVQMVSMRGLVSALGMFLFVFLTNRQMFKVDLKELVLMALSGLSMFGTASCYYVSMQTSSVSTAVVLMYTAPIFVMIYSVLFFGEKLTKPKLLSVIGMLVGCCLVSGIVGGIKFNAMGIMAGLVSGISYGAYNIFTKMQMRHKTKPVAAAMYCFIFMAAIALCATNPLSMVAIVVQKPMVIIPIVLGLGLFTGLLPYVLYTLALKDMPAGTVSAMGILEPMAATIFSILLFHEKLSFYSACGIILILGSVLLLSRSDE